MRLSDLKVKRPAHGQWVVDWSRMGECDYGDPEWVCEVHAPSLQLHLGSFFREHLNEMTYRGLAAGIDHSFLQQGTRTQKGYRLADGSGPYDFAANGISYQGMNADGTMIFFITPSTEYKNRAKPPYYACQVKFVDWDEICSNPDQTPREKASLLMWTSDVQLDCTDPSFKWWGYQYILTKMNAAVVPNTIYPDVRNPELHGIVCKHLNRVLVIVPFYINDIAKAIVNQWGGKLDTKQLDAIRRRATAQQAVNQQANPELPPESETPPEGYDQEMPVWPEFDMPPEGEPEAAPGEEPDENL